MFHPSNFINWKYLFSPPPHLHFSLSVAMVTSCQQVELDSNSPGLYQASLAFLPKAWRSHVAVLTRAPGRSWKHVGNSLVGPYLTTGAEDLIYKGYPFPSWEKQP